MIEAMVHEWTAEPEDLQRVQLSLVIPRKKAELLPPAGTVLKVTVKKNVKKRSLNANAYMWKLCDEIAKAVGTDKETVYRGAVREAGVCEHLAAKNDAYERLKEKWSERGIAWFTEVTDVGMVYTEFNLYFGSSVYTSDQMAAVIENLVGKAEELGIDTVTPRERAMMIEDWGRQNA